MCNAEAKVAFTSKKNLVTRVSSLYIQPSETIGLYFPFQISVGHYTSFIHALIFQHQFLLFHQNIY